MRLADEDHGGAACSRLEKTVRAITGEALHRPTVGKPNV
jgi:hypothetical protein